MSFIFTHVFFMSVLWYNSRNNCDTNTECISIYIYIYMRVYLYTNTYVYACVLLYVCCLLVLVTLSANPPYSGYCTCNWHCQAFPTMLGTNTFYGCYWEWVWQNLGTNNYMHRPTTWGILQFASKVSLGPNKEHKLH